MICCNPLFIGTPLSTVTVPAPLDLRQMMLQSPLHRDSPFNTKAGLVSTSRSSCNPLFIGTRCNTLLQRPGWKTYWLWQYSLQSPLLEASLPSSSGLPFLPPHRALCGLTWKKLQSPLHRDSPFNAGMMKWNWRSFRSCNPLFIGTPLQHGSKFYIGETSEMLQSPLHRDSPFNDSLCQRPSH